MLVELLVVVGLLFVLFVVYNSRTSVNFQKRQKALCRQNLQTIHLALQTYSLDHAEKFPFVRGAKSSEAPLSLLVPKYTTRTDVFICPGTKHRPLPQGEPFADRKISYAYLMGVTSQAGREQWTMADALLRPEASRRGEVIFSTTGEGAAVNHDKYGGVILFADGTVEMTRPKTEYSLAKPTGTLILNPKN